MAGVDFGVYHHSSIEESEKLRKMAGSMFIESFKKLKLDAHGKIKILDIGAGSGFLTYTAASYFTMAEITDIDNFSASLKDNSREKLEKNLQILNIKNRVNIIEGDIKDIEIKDKFDLAISSLVLHNLGKGRFKAYNNIKKMLVKGGYFINADGFIRKNIFVDPFKSDMNKLNNIFEPVFAMSPEDEKKSAWKYILVALKAQD